MQEVPSDILREQFILAAPTGDGPDIVVGAHDWIGELSTNGVLEPLRSPTRTSSRRWPIEAFTYDGTLYGVPYAVENIALIRNTDLVPEAPATFEEMVQIATDYKAQYPDDPTQLGIAVQVGAEGDPYHFQPILSAFGGYMLGQNEDGTFNVEDVGIDSRAASTPPSSSPSPAAAGILSADVDLRRDDHELRRGQGAVRHHRPVGDRPGRQRLRRHWRALRGHARSPPARAASRRPSSSACRGSWSRRSPRRRTSPRASSRTS